MARPKLESPPASMILGLADSEGRISVRVTPGAKREQITILDGQLMVKLHAPPQDGAANAALCKMLGKALGIAPSRLHIVRGEHSRDKVIAVTTQS